MAQAGAALAARALQPRNSPAAPSSRAMLTSVPSRRRRGMGEAAESPPGRTSTPSCTRVLTTSRGVVAAPASAPAAAPAAMLARNSAAPSSGPACARARRARWRRRRRCGTACRRPAAPRPRRRRPPATRRRAGGRCPPWAPTWPARRGCRARGWRGPRAALCATARPACRRRGAGRGEWGRPRARGRPGTPRRTSALGGRHGSPHSWGSSAPGSSSSPRPGGSPPGRRRWTRPLPQHCDAPS